MTGISAAGLGSGLDIKGLVDQLVAAERTPFSNRLNLKEAKTSQELTSVGKVKSALANLQGVLTQLAESSAFTGRTTSVGEPDLASVSATSAAAAGSYSVEVLAVATQQRIASQVFTDSATEVGWGTLSFTIDGETFNVDIADDPEANTLTGIRDAINEAGNAYGLFAGVVVADDGARLILTSEEPGSAHEFSIASSGGDGGLSVLDYTTAAPGAMTVLTAATDAQVTIDGFTVTSTSNTISSAVDGLTIEVLEADPGNTFTVSIGLDKGKTRATLESFITAYNGVVTAIKGETAFDADSGVAGNLLGDSAIRSIQESLRREISRVIDDDSLAFTTLAQLGVKTKIDGTLEIEAERLDAALNANFDAVEALFTSDEGIGTRMDELVSTMLGTSGQIETRESRLRSVLDLIGEDRERLETRMASVRSRLEKQFNAMDQLIAQLNQTSQYLASQLGGLST